MPAFCSPSCCILFLLKQMAEKQNEIVKEFKTDKCADVPQVGKEMQLKGKKKKRIKLAYKILNQERCFLHL